MNNFIAILIVLSFFVFLFGIGWLAFSWLKKKPKKKSLILIIVSIVVFFIAAFAYKDANYVVTTASEGNQFYEKVDSGGDLTGKTVEFKVKATGKNEDYVALEMPGKKVIDVFVINNKKTRAIKKGDAVIVKIDKVGKFMGAIFIKSDLESIN